MDTLQKAKELGISITQSEEAKALKQSEELTNQDEKAKALMDEYKKIKDSVFREARAKGFEAITEAFNKIEQKEQEMNGYDITKHYLDCKKKFEDLNNKIEELMVKCQEAKTLQESEALAKQDEECVALLDEYDQIQEALFQAKMERKVAEEIAQLEEKLEQNKVLINEHELTRKYFEDKRNYNTTIYGIEKIVRDEIESKGFSYKGIGLFRFWKT